MLIRGLFKCQYICLNGNIIKKIDYAEHYELCSDNKTYEKLFNNNLIILVKNNQHSFTNFYAIVYKNYTRYRLV